MRAGGEGPAMVVLLLLLLLLLLLVASRICSQVHGFVLLSSPDDDDDDDDALRQIQNVSGGGTGVRATCSPPYRSSISLAARYDTPCELRAMGLPPVLGSGWTCSSDHSTSNIVVELLLVVALDMFIYSSMFRQTQSQ